MDEHTHAIDGHRGFIAMETLPLFLLDYRTMNDVQKSNNSLRFNVLITMVYISGKDFAFVL
jgi:hypothetical protein